MGFCNECTHWQETPFTKMGVCHNPATQSKIKMEGITAISDRVVLFTGSWFGCINYRQHYGPAVHWDDLLKDEGLI